MLYQENLFFLINEEFEQAVYVFYINSAAQVISVLLKNIPGHFYRGLADCVIYVRIILLNRLFQENDSTLQIYLDKC